MGMQSKVLAWFFLILYAVLLITLVMGRDMIAMYLMGIGMFLEAAIAVWALYRKWVFSNRSHFFLIFI